MYLLPQTGTRARPSGSLGYPGGRRYSSLGTTIRPIRRRRYLGQATSSADLATEILAQVCPSGVGKSPCTTESVSIFQSFLEQAINSRALPAPTQQTASTTCSGQATTSGLTQAAKVTSAAGSMLAGTTSSLIAAGASIGSVVPVIGTIIGAVAGVLGGIFMHHDQAVAEQSNVLCSNVPAFNAAVQAIQAAVAQGSMTPSAASSDYAQLLSQFQAALKSDPSYKAGDALDGYNIAAQCVVAALNSDLEAQSGGTVSSGSLLSGGIPGWMLLLGAGVLLYELA